MILGAFSISLAVKDLQSSKSFYEKLGFEQYAGEMDQNWLIMKNGETVIGLFEGMFESNLMTFNPGWDQQSNPLESFTDIREIQKNLKQNGVTLISEAEEAGSGPASFTVADPDGNVILFDQHVQG